MLSIYLSLLDTPQEREWFTQIYQSHRKVMHAIANSVLHDAALAENIVHDTFLHIIENSEIFVSQGCHKTLGLIDIVVKRKAINEYHRAQKSQPHEDVETMIEPTAAPVENLVISRETIEMVIHEIERLDEKYRAVLILRYVYELSPRETAKLLDLPEGTVRQQLSRGRRKLAERLKPANKKSIAK